MPTETSLPPTIAPQSAQSPLRWRSVVIGALLVPIAVYYGNYAYVVVQALLWGQTSLLRGPVMVLFLLALANIAFRRISKRAGLEAWEMLIIYSMIAIATCVSGFGMVQWLVNMLPAQAHYANAVNHFDTLEHLVPSFLVPHNPQVVDDFYRGGSSMYRPDILTDWAVPVVAWSLFILTFAWVSLCLCAIVRKQWIEGEHIAFPLVYLPIDMAVGASGGTPFFKNRLMWAGFAIAGLLESIDYINYMYPSMPYIQIKPYHLEQFFTIPPWNSVGTFTTAFYPFAIGIAFLLSVEVSFSCWFFYLLTKVEKVLSNSLGLVGTSHAGVCNPPYIAEQGVGAFIALALFLLYRSRKTMAAAICSAWDKTAVAASTDDGSPLSPRVAVWSGLAGIAVLTACMNVLGLPIWAAAAFWVVYFLFLVVLTRIVSEAGAGWAWGPLSPVHTVLMQVDGATGFDAKSLSAFGYVGWFDAEFRDAPMPHTLAAMKIGQETDTRPKILLWALVIAAVVGVFSAFWAYLHMYYEFGAGTAKVRPALQGLGMSMLKNISGWINFPTGPDPHAIGAMSAGAVILLAMAVMRQNFLWWPFHPIGYALGQTYSMEYMWCPFLVGWALKSLTLRYGGTKKYSLVLPFFLGLILGDYVVPTLWGVFGILTHNQVYMAFPH